ncbi:hypothetical protein Pcinc_006519 [Petrolisthes cinctipes]|uniref:Uncharacterized protein n=1 Tax=Petrolisthes cinctipes TaxID=88211 RepID=A0AAE1GCU9_PETCI|nr:hypothetical protein Pcinc_006519 [Petrolisthes cinctipes]
MVVILAVFSVGLVLLLVPTLLYCFWCRRRQRYVSTITTRSCLHDNFNRASFYLASTSLHDLNFTQLMCHLTANQTYPSQMLCPCTITTPACTLHSPTIPSNTTTATTHSTNFTPTLPPTFPSRPPLPPPPTYPLPSTPLQLKRKGRGKNLCDHGGLKQRSPVNEDSDVTNNNNNNNIKRNNKRQCSPGQRVESQLCQGVNWEYNEEHRPVAVPSKKKKTRPALTNTHSEKTHSHNIIINHKNNLQPQEYNHHNSHNNNHKNNLQPQEYHHHHNHHNNNQKKNLQPQEYHHHNSHNNNHKNIIQPQEYHHHHHHHNNNNKNKLQPQESHHHNNNNKNISHKNKLHPQKSHHQYDLDPLRSLNKSSGTKVKVSPREETSMGRKLQEDKKGSSSVLTTSPGGHNNNNSPRSGHHHHHHHTTHQPPPTPLPEPPAQPPHVVATFLSHSRYVP